KQILNRKKMNFCLNKKLFQIRLNRFQTILNLRKLKLKDREVKNELTSQKDFDDATFSGKETNYGYVISKGEQTGGADKASHGTSSKSSDDELEGIIVDTYRTVSKATSTTAVSTVTSK